jgi:hypothetical protein
LFFRSNGEQRRPPRIYATPQFSGVIISFREHAMLLVRGFALLLLFAIAALAFNTAIPTRDSGRLVRRAAMITPPAQTYAAYETDDERVAELPVGQN